MAGAVSKSSSFENRDVDVKKRDVLDNISNLETRILALQRDWSSHLHSGRLELHYLVHASEEFETKLVSESKAKKCELNNQLKQIKNSVVDFVRMLEDMKPGQAFVEKLKRTMEEIETAIVVFKRNHSEEFELLLQEEKTLSQEIMSFDKKLESWSTTSVVLKKPVANGAGTVGSQGRAENVPPPVLAFERFLQQTGGHQGGWDDYDHQTFLRLRNRYHDQSVFLEKATHEIPTKTLNEIDEHEQWYAEYCTLLGSKKKAIEEWKTQREHDKIDAKVQIGGGDLLATKRQHKKEELYAKEREERFAKLSAWKEQQEQEQRKREAEKMRVQSENKKKREMEKKRRILLKEEVKEYIHSREDQKKLEQERIEVEKMKENERRKAATKKVAQFRERDLTKLAERKEMLKEKEAQNYLREKRLEELRDQVRVNAARDPTRLFKPTASVREREKSGPGSGMGGATLVMPRRAVPTWRKT